MTTKKSTLEQLQGAEADIRAKSYAAALTAIGKAKTMVGELREPAKEEPTPPHEEGAVLASEDFESGFGWLPLQAIPGRATIVTASPFHGTHDARFEVRQGDVEPETGSARAEITGPTFKEGDDLYIRDAIRIPSADSFDGDWQIVQQMHDAEGYDGSPATAILLDTDPYALRIGSGDSKVLYLRLPIETDTWYDITRRVVLSKTQGLVEVWVDGVQQTLADGRTQMTGVTMYGGISYLKAGIYRAEESKGTSLVEHDNLVVASSLAAALGA